MPSSKTSFRTRDETPEFFRCVINFIIYVEFRIIINTGGPCHPWLFIEEAATKEVEKDFNSVYSRLVLCKTYRLDEDGKVLTPEEV